MSSMMKDEAKTELVLKGGTRLAFVLWEGASPAVRRNCSLVVCNLAVGKVCGTHTSYSGKILLLRFSFMQPL